MNIFRHFTSPSIDKKETTDENVFSSGESDYNQHRQYAACWQYHSETLNLIYETTYPVTWEVSIDTVERVGERERPSWNAMGRLLATAHIALEKYNLMSNLDRLRHWQVHIRQYSCMWLYPLLPCTPYAGPDIPVGRVVVRRVGSYPAALVYGNLYGKSEKSLQWLIQ